MVTANGPPAINPFLKSFNLESNRLFYLLVSFYSASIVNCADLPTL